jgi:putative flippase GtrA
MTPVSLCEDTRIRVLTGWRNRAVSFKAVAFALVGIVNTAVDYGVFLAARAAFDHSAAALVLFSSLSNFCWFGSGAMLSLVAANMLSWIVAVSGSYILNSTITFAAESGRKLRWSTYFVFVMSGVTGWLGNTTTLLIAAQVLLLPVWLAKLLAVMVSFIVNFSLSHFVVFHMRRSLLATPCL